MLTTLRNLLTKKLTLVTLVLVVLMFALGGDTVLAAEAGKSGDGTFAGNALQSFLWILVNGVFGLMVGFGGTLLNTAVNGFVIGFGDFYINRGLGATIDSLWVIVRDIFNLTFIFGLVAIGLKMIFNSGDSSAKKMLISLIMAALLVNFSLFITKFVVDFSNIAAVQLVGAFPKTNGLPDISGHFMQLMGLKGIFNVGSFDPSAFTNGGGLGYIFGTMILFMVTAFVFFAGSILLLIRFAVLNIYMVLSPLMFIGWVFPSAASITSQYWKGFLGRAFFAPAYILMLYFSQKILSTFGAGSVQASISGIFKPGSQTSFGEVMPPFILTIIFLIASIVIAQKMGANGASGFVSMGQSMAGKVRKGAVFSGKYAGGFAISKVRSGLDRVAQDDGNTTTKPILRQIRQVARGVARGTSVYGGRAVLDAGASTYDSSQAKTKKNWNEQYARDAAAKNASTIETGQTSQAELDAIRVKQAASTATPADLAKLPSLEKAEQAMMSAITSLAISELEKMTPEALAKIAPHLTHSQVESFMKSDKVSAIAQGSVISARRNAIDKTLRASGNLLTTELTKLTTEQIETMGDDWIRENAHLLSHPQMDNLKKSKKFTESQHNSFIAQRKGWHAAAVAGTTFNGKPTNIADLFEHTAGGGDRKPEDIANLGSKTLLDPASLFYITADALETIADKKTLTATDKALLKANLLATPGPHHAAITAYFGSPHGLRFW